jgi:hypothetical protein
MYWGYIKRKYIIPKWQQYLLFFRRFIDDKFGVWLGSSDDFKNFITDMNTYCQLSWETTSLSKSTTCLDLTISISQENTIHIKTFQKPTNLHLYIPPNSAHPPGVLKSIVYGNLCRYWLQNTNITDFITVTQQFANRFSARGHNKHKIIHLFSEAAKRLDGTITTNKHAKNNTIYLHWTWHLHDIRKSKLRAVFNGTLKEKCRFNNLIIAYNRPKNLRDCLIKTQLNQPEGSRVSSLLPPL